eukprot:TRINITY_DN12685_c0_g1_i1.p1 TRINITY_DN12685_c0_g1~~TRINITY_DN12685_c0_g1_i1.p1  ORF type:complete len:394 (-),score=47.96 TRINITY_DN12685_c0_g1_i1:599-1780(-)
MSFYIRSEYISMVVCLFFFNDPATTEIYTLHIVGSVRCVQETVSTQSTWEKKEERGPHQKRRITNWHWISGIAAGLFLILSMGLYTHLEQQEPVLTDTYSNPNDAYKEAQKALLLVSDNLNKGVSELENAQKGMNKANKILDEQISQQQNIAMKLKHVLFTILMCFASMTFAQNKLVEKFGDMNGVTSVYISKSMLQMMPNMKTEGIDIGGIAGKLESILILTSEKASISNMMKSEVTHFAYDRKYEELMRVKDEGSKVTFYIKKKNNGKISELVMLVDEHPEFVFMQIMGDMTLQDIQKITKGKRQTDNVSQPYQLVNPLKCNQLSTKQTLQRVKSKQSTAFTFHSLSYLQSSKKRDPICIQNCQYCQIIIILQQIQASIQEMFLPLFDLFY